MKKKSIKKRGARTDKVRSCQTPMDKGQTADPLSHSCPQGPTAMSAWFKGHKRLVEIAGLLLIITIGLLVRIEDLRDWQQYPHRAFYKGQPLLTTFDGYYYLTLARDLVEGTYLPVNRMRAVPDYPSRPWPPPLLSVLAAGVAKATGLSLNWIGIMLPAVLGLLLVVPLYGLGRFYGGPVMGFTASLTGLLSFYYVYRSSLGWFDTDCMNVTWATGAAWCFLTFGTCSTRKRYWYLMAGMVTFILFLWWWDQTPQVATLVTLVPLLVALVFFYRPTKGEGIIFLMAVMAMAIVVLAWKGVDLPARIVSDAVHRYNYISKEATGYFPNMGLTISEQERPDLSEIVAKTTDSLPVFLVSCLGLGLLFVKKPKTSLFLSVPLVLGIFSFLFAKRFLIFLAPMTALGTGFIASTLWGYRTRSRAFVVAVPVFVVLVAWPSFSKDMKKNFWPKEPPHLIAGMDLASRKTASNGVIWAWWDHGYPINYWARRATINDGSVHNPERSVYNGIPLATHDERLAANFMRFYVARGLTGIHKFYEATGEGADRGLPLIKRILAAGPEGARNILKGIRFKANAHGATENDWLEFFYPRHVRPVYLFLDWRLTFTNYWWFWLGTWNPALHDGIHPFYQSIYGLRLSDNVARNADGFEADLEKAVAVFQGRRFLLKRAVIYTGDSIEEFARGHGSINLELYAPADFAAIEDDAIAESVFNKLFIRHRPGKYFSLVAERVPSFQIWKVDGDRLE